MDSSLRYRSAIDNKNLTCPFNRYWSVGNRYNHFPMYQDKMAFCIKCSFSGTILAAASSKITIGASLSMALAVEVRCF